MNAATKIQDAATDNGQSALPRVERLLVPIDFSAPTIHILRQARALAEKFGTVINLLLIIPPRVTRRRGPLRENLVRTIAEATRQELGKLIEVLWPAEIKATLAIREGAPCNVIVEEACAAKAQLIMVSADAGTGLGGWWRRRALKRLVRHAPCPVWQIF